MALVLVLCATGCVSHPVGPARTEGSYRGKAVTTAESAASAVSTVILAARTGSDGNAFGPYLSVLIGEQEEALSGLTGTFDSIQPPDGRSDDLRAELDQLLADALDHVSGVRVAVRRGQLRTLAAKAAPLRADVDRLDAFIEDHR